MIPALILRLPMEGEPSVRLEASTEGEQVRLLDWIDGQEDLSALIGRALALIEERSAAT